MSRKKPSTRTNTSTEPKLKSSTTYKDTLLKVLCKDPKRAIEVINALTGSDYPPTAKVEICDLDNSLMRRYNDVGLHIEGELIILIEHQSTISPNLPLRFLSYIVDILFFWFVKVDDLYGNTLYKIPTPKFYVLYNGTEQLKHSHLKLSDAFTLPDEVAGLELTAQVLDVNYGSGHEILEKSPLIAGYSYLIEQIRRQMETGSNRDQAIRKGIEICLEEGILTDLLKENYEEVIQMLDIQYSKEAEFRIIRQEGEAIGEARGEARGEERKAIEVAKNFLELGIPIETVASATGLDIEKLKTLVRGTAG